MASGGSSEDAAAPAVRTPSEAAAACSLPPSPAPSNLPPAAAPAAPPAAAQSSAAGPGSLPADRNGEPRAPVLRTPPPETCGGDACSDLLRQLRQQQAMNDDLRAGLARRRMRQPAPAAAAPGPDCAPPDRRQRQPSAAELGPPRSDIHPWRYRGYRDAPSDRAALRGERAFRDLSHSYSRRTAARRLLTARERELIEADSRPLALCDYPFDAADPLRAVSGGLSRHSAPLRQESRAGELPLSRYATGADAGWAVRGREAGGAADRRRSSCSGGTTPAERPGSAALASERASLGDPGRRRSGHSGGYSTGSPPPPSRRPPSPSPSRVPAPPYDDAGRPSGYLGCADPRDRPYAPVDDAPPLGRESAVYTPREAQWLQRMAVTADAWADCGPSGVPTTFHSMWGAGREDFAVPRGDDDGSRRITDRPAGARPPLREAPSARDRMQAACGELRDSENAERLERMQRGPRPRELAQELCRRERLNDLSLWEGEGGAREAARWGDLKAWSVRDTEHQMEQEMRALFDA